MSKRRKQAEPELPLFDLPLHDEAEAESPTLEVPASPPPAAPKAPRKPRRKPKVPSPPETPMLFSEEELTASARDTSEQRDISKRYAQAEALSDDGQEAPLIQDRLLGGLADLTIHLAVLGSMIVAVQLMGIPVAFSDWPAFVGLAVIFSGLYSVVPLAFWGHTPGMAWVGHSARSESDEPLSFGQTVMRWTGALFTVLLFGLPLLLGLAGRSLADRLSDSKTLQL